MSVSVDDIMELLEQWAELNLSVHGNLSVSMVTCSGAAGQTFLSALLSLYALMFLLGLAANASIIWLSLSSHRCDQFVLHLAVADLVAVVTLPLWAWPLSGGSWWFGELTCRLTHLLIGAAAYCSVWLTCCLSYTHSSRLSSAPPSQRSELIGRLVCVTVWLLALAASAPEAYYLKVLPSSRGLSVCQPVYPSDRWLSGVHLSFTVLALLLPLPVLARGAMLAGQRRGLLLGYLAVYACCWLPLHAAILLDVMMLTGVMSFSCGTEHFLYVALQLATCLWLARCVFNPSVYLLADRRACEVIRGRCDVIKAFFFRFNISGRNNSNSSTGLDTLLHRTHSDASDCTQHTNV